MRAGPEKNLQRRVIDFLKIALPADAAYLVIPGGDGRHTRSPGYRNGTPDMLVLYRGAALFFELKALGKKPSDDQLAMSRSLFAAGCTTHVCYSEEAVSEALWLAGVPLKARLHAAEQAARKVA